MKSKKYYFISKFIVALQLMILCSSLPAENWILNPGTGITTSGEVELAISSSGPVIAYNDNQGDLYLARFQEATGIWKTQQVPGVSNLHLEALAVSGDTVVVGYINSGNLYTVQEKRGSFSSPVCQVSNQAVSIVDFDTDRLGTIFGIFHRHGSYWDFNFLSSQDSGQSFTIIEDFTSRNDSSSTGYTGNIVAANGNLYTAYQDNNDSYAIRYGWSADSGKTWQFFSIPAALGIVDIAVNPNNQDEVVIASVTSNGLSVMRSVNSRGIHPDFQQVYADTQIQFSRNKVKYVDIGILENGSIHLFYPGSDQSIYTISTNNGGSSWGSAEKVGDTKLWEAWWKTDLEVSGNSLWFAFLNSNGETEVYKNVSTDTAGFLGSISYPDEDGLIILDPFDRPVSFYQNDDTMLLFSPDVSGFYTLGTDLKAGDMYIAVYDLMSDSNEAVADNLGESSLLSSIENFEITAGNSYLILMKSFNEMISGELMTFRLQQGNAVPVENTLPTPDEVAYIEWNSTAEPWRGQIGHIIEIHISPTDNVGPLWGTDIYSHDSFIATAAVHAGLIKKEQGGVVYIRMLGPQEKYYGTTRNGVSSSDYGPWHGSYEFVK